MNALWIWYLGKNDLDGLIKVCDKYNIDTLLIHYNCFHLKTYIEYIYPNRFKYEVLVGDANHKFTLNEIMSIVDKYPNEIIHFNLEHYHRTKGLEEFNDYLESLMLPLYDLDINMTFDIQTWNHTKRYKQLMSMCNKVYLMAYSNTLIGTLFKVVQWFNYNLVVGLELNPEYKRAYLHNSEKNIPIIDNLCKRFLPKYNGLAIHHFGILK